MPATTDMTMMLQAPHLSSVPVGLRVGRDATSPGRP
jgi:hypothetical protein